MEPAQHVLKGFKQASLQRFKRYRMQMYDKKTASDIKPVYKLALTVHEK